MYIAAQQSKPNVKKMCFSGHIQTTSFYHGRVLKTLADVQCSYINKGNICHLNHVHTTLTIGMVWLYGSIKKQNTTRLEAILLLHWRAKVWLMR